MRKVCSDERPDRSHIAEKSLIERQAQVQEMKKKAHDAHERALAAEANKRSCATQFSCAVEELSVKKQSLSILKDKRLQLTKELTELRETEAELRKELVIRRFAFDLDA